MYGRSSERPTFPHPPTSSRTWASGFPANPLGEKALTDEPLYVGEPVLAVAAVDEETAAAAIEAIDIDFEPLAVRRGPARDAAPRRAQCTRGRQLLGSAGG